MAVDDERAARRRRAAEGAAQMLLVAGFTETDAARVSMLLFTDDDRMVVVVLPWDPGTVELVQHGDRVEIAATPDADAITLLVQQVAYSGARDRVGLAALHVPNDGDPDWRISDATGMPR